MTRSPRGGPRADAGIGLVEMLVAMLVSSIVLAALGTVVLRTLSGSRDVNERITATSDARAAADVMMRRLRVAYPPTAQPAAFTVAGRDRVVFYSSIATPGSTADVPPTRVEYTVDTTAGCLRETRTPAAGTEPNYTWPTSGSRSTCIAFGRFNADGARLFRYFSDVGTGAVALTPDGSGRVPAASLASIEAVELTLAVQAPGSAGTPVHVRDRVTLSNVIAATTTGGS